MQPLKKLPSLVLTIYSYSETLYGYTINYYEEWTLQNDSSSGSTQSFASLIGRTFKLARFVCNGEENSSQTGSVTIKSGTELNLTRNGKTSTITYKANTSNNTVSISYNGYDITYKFASDFKSYTGSYSETQYGITYNSYYEKWTIVPFNYGTAIEFADLTYIEDPVWKYGYTQESVMPNGTYRVFNININKAISNVTSEINEFITRYTGTNINITRSDINDTNKYFMPDEYNICDYIDNEVRFFIIFKKIDSDCNIVITNYTSNSIYTYIIKNNVPFADGYEWR